MMVLLASGSLMAAPVPAPTAGITREQLDEAIATLVANGEVWAKGKNIPTNDRADLSGLKFDKGSAPVVIAALRGIKKNLTGLYATARLLEALETSNVEAIKEILSQVRIIQVRVKSYYRRFPVLSKSRVEAMGMPAYSSRLTTDAIMNRMAGLAGARAAKKARDLPIAKQNEAVWDIEQAAFRMQAAAGGKTDDTRAVNAMIMAERTSDASFVIMANTYTAAARKMDADRAARLYKILRVPSLRLRMVNRKNYTCKGKCVLHDIATSQFTSMPDYPGVKMLTLMNSLAIAAKNKKCPKVPVPTAKEIQAYNKKKKKK